MLKMNHDNSLDKQDKDEDEDDEIRVDDNKEWPQFNKLLHCI